MDPKILTLYVIPDRRLGAPCSILEQTFAALEGGATAIQLRDKDLSARELTDLASRMTEMCRKKGAKLFVNDRLDVALAAGADGCHLGQSDLPLAAARKLAPRPFLLGRSARTVEQARIALEEGADYLGVGAVYPTGTKDDASVIGVEGLKTVVEFTSLPVVAIGGIGSSSVREVMATGASGVAVVSAVVGTPDPTSSTVELLKLTTKP
ncbi:MULTISPECIES: thiamine phosphate synthase [Dethiosulfovibrio]|jgi:thiamine-phosphate pyrophosphorylase|uniref:Thiamine-phosphate synthase n=2 Tax=Dethiosulfovibrio TaxID=47054 RepID=A0ABS9EU29_9BACT|nr:MULTISPECIES: thiamine phosphate synthase [Dethiosulfovibrio]MCF4114291.1 thiamine phosphate synthase [Dethiosulfovibrio russensis]MCF4143283.1 thiamine phosphate synthase [Dethiosulfovibrio marinus]MCF4145452.1 thiamine phosphate synthase [Dethiosulfovibrio acidaminovorans]